MKQDLLKQIMSGDKIPVERGCNNKSGCFCSGKCKEIIGWYVNGKFIPNNSNQADTIKYQHEEIKKLLGVDSTSPEIKNDDLEGLFEKGKH